MSQSLDSTTVQFGGASLKLVATATTVTVELGSAGYPITIHPFWKWIGSLYIKSSIAAITGTL